MSEVPANDSGGIQWPVCGRPFVFSSLGLECDSGYSADFFYYSLVFIVITILTLYQFYLVLKEKTRLLEILLKGFL